MVVKVYWVVITIYGLRDIGEWWASYQSTGIFGVMCLDVTGDRNERVSPRRYQRWVSVVVVLVGFNRMGTLKAGVDC